MLPGILASVIILGGVIAILVITALTYANTNSIRDNTETQQTVKTTVDNLPFLDRNRVYVQSSRSIGETDFADERTDIGQTALGPQFRFGTNSQKVRLNLLQSTHATTLGLSRNLELGDLLEGSGLLSNQSAHAVPELSDVATNPASGCWQYEITLTNGVVLRGLSPVLAEATQIFGDESGEWFIPELYFGSQDATFTPKTGVPSFRQPSNSVLTMWSVSVPSTVSGVDEHKALDRTFEQLLEDKALTGSAPIQEMWVELNQSLFDSISDDDQHMDNESDAMNATFSGFQLRFNYPEGSDANASVGHLQVRPSRFLPPAAFTLTMAASTVSGTGADLNMNLKSATEQIRALMSNTADRITSAEWKLTCMFPYDSSGTTLRAKETFTSSDGLPTDTAGIDLNFAGSMPQIPIADSTFVCRLGVEVTIDYTDDENTDQFRIWTSNDFNMTPMITP